ncbi:S8 family serine peptidase [Candidatus Azambacteria bacterium]|nr:S8 family serine peptidase [Candidatus Azambacteria bacterium]
MKRPYFRFVSVFLVAIVVSGFFGFVFAESEEINLPQRKIVVFKDGVSDVEKGRILSAARSVKVHKLRHGDALVAYVDNTSETKLLKNAKVVRVEDDVVVEALEGAADATDKKAKPAATQPVQMLPWGVYRINADRVWTLGETGGGINIGIIDTGISTTHPDLLGNIKGGVSEVAYTSNWNDDNGHGSHVAGVVAALNNTIGVVGGVPAANLYAIKVLDRNGSGYLSDVIDGIDWATANGMQVINLSLGTTTDVRSLHDAVIRAQNAGVVVVAAAGNSGGSVIYPAAYPEAIAVAATDFSNSAPYWSSRGPEVDLAAPGVSIYSTYKGTKYATLSGTSMASPHVAAAAAFVLKRATDTAFDELDNSCVSEFDVNCNGAWDPKEVQAKLEATATDLGTGGQDDIYGYGLVSAYAAFTN